MKVEVKRSVMSDMRRIGTLFIHFEVAIHETAPETTVGVKDMVSRDNFAALETAVQNSTVTDEEHRSNRG